MRKAAIRFLTSVAVSRQLQGRKRHQISVEA
jgi:hypothetical protein